LTDYIRGDSYFKPGPNDFSNLNKIRAISQLTLFRRLKKANDVIRQEIETLAGEFRK